MNGALIRQNIKYLFTLDATNVFYLCGLYKIVDGKFRFVILTRAANRSMIEVHDRMPVIVGEHQVRAYLTDRTAASEIVANASPILTKQRA